MLHVLLELCLHVLEQFFDALHLIFVGVIVSALLVAEFVALDARDESVHVAELDVFELRQIVAAEYEGLRLVAGTGTWV